MRCRINVGHFVFSYVVRRNATPERNIITQYPLCKVSFFFKNKLRSINNDVLITIQMVHCILIIFYKPRRFRQQCYIRKSLRRQGNKHANKRTNFTQHAHYS